MKRVRRSLALSSLWKLRLSCTAESEYLSEIFSMQPHVQPAASAVAMASRLDRHAHLSFAVPYSPRRCFFVSDSGAASWCFVVTSWNMP